MGYSMEYLRDINMISIIFRVFLAIVIGGILGFERERKHRPAGFRTYILVCLGSAMVMMTNQYVYEFYGLGDPVRMGAQVISGIGFLGAGTIMVTGRNKIKGITTAACLWTAACSGLAIGIGFYELALISGVIIILIMSGFHGLDAWTRKHSKYLDLYIEYNNANSAFSEFFVYARENQIEISNVQASQEEVYPAERGKQRTISYTLTVKSLTKRTHAEVLDVLMKAKGIQYIEEL